ncbi:prolipoprotein diacylglyceryl transferase [Granulicella sp. 5B5]|uniref:prolipoprotein diacylglyceryl transferase n=1 Tax=Granulicella sp. 5B5 TaxID=1617967 RepID=UPI0015F6712E|nr:prolipoprotein diacylglyceryl transferase family protein [Granulicella sp. 5B5]QMV17445.1 prolipoprotein diacylglyceryl transferase [Granulicella sp. 5B5]
MYPYIHLGSFHIGTFGLLLWLAAVFATIVLYRNFERHGVDTDALNVVTIVVLAGILGAKLWHELQDPRALVIAWHQILLPGLAHPIDIIRGFLAWFAAGFAWYGGLLAGIAALYWQGSIARFKGPAENIPGPRLGGLRMLDLAAPATALGYGIGRIGCLTSGDGDYGINTTLPWGVHMAKDALVPPTPPDALVQPTPVYELLFSLLVFWILWKLGKTNKPVGWMTGLYLILSGIGRFLVEFVRINPKLYWGMSNAQVAAIGSILLGILAMLWSARVNKPWNPSQTQRTEA